MRRLCAQADMNAAWGDVNHQREGMQGRMEAAYTAWDREDGARVVRTLEPLVSSRLDQVHASWWGWTFVCQRLYVCQRLCVCCLSFMRANHSRWVEGGGRAFWGGGGLQVPGKRGVLLYNAEASSLNNQQELVMHQAFNGWAGETQKRAMRRSAREGFQGQWFEVEVDVPKLVRAPSAHVS